MLQCFLCSYLMDHVDLLHDHGFSLDKNKTGNPPLGIETNGSDLGLEQ